MANKITRTNLKSSDFVDAASRYINGEVIYYGDQNYLTFTTYKKRKRLLSKEDKFTSISLGHQYRPDLLSNEVYGTPDFWWKIMEFNNISDVFEFEAGKTIRLPASLFT